MDMKLGGWSKPSGPEILKVISRSSGVIQGQIAKHGRMDLKLGGWGKPLVPKNLKVISRSSGVIQGQIAKDGRMDLKLGGWVSLWRRKC